MAKTFSPLDGETIEIIDGETSVDVNEDIVSEQVSNYLLFSLAKINTKSIKQLIQL